MNRIFDFIKVRRANARNRPGTVNSAPRGRGVFMALALAIAVGSAGQTSPAQAAPAGATEIRFSMLARKLKGNATICVGDDVPIYVRVVRAEFVGSSALAKNAQDLPGVRVEATMSNEDVGNLFPIAINTGYDTNYPDGAPYSFLAGAVGTTTITFKGTINHIWWPAKLFNLGPLPDRRDFVEAHVEIKVEDCQYKVTQISRWVNVYKLYNAVAWITEAGMTVDAQGHYSGSASVDWTLTHIELPPCSLTVQVPPTGTAELNGELDAPNHILDMVIQIQSLVFQQRFVCPKAVDLVLTPAINPEALTISVPSSGGTSPQPHPLINGKGVEGGIGTSITIVTRVNKP